jgi:hypothetical protein
VIQFIAHRINRKTELTNINPKYGVELDLRDFNGLIHIEHEPFCVGESFEDYAANYHHGVMILNIKCDGIEHRVLEIVKRHGITNYFFLDSAFPTIKLLSDRGEHNLAIRFSEFEGMDTIRAMKGRVGWVWVDCFTIFPMDKTIYDEIKQLGYKICIVSPELQQQESKIEQYGDYMKRKTLIPDAICSKVHNFERWARIFDLTL